MYDISLQYNSCFYLISKFSDKWCLYWLEIVISCAASQVTIRTFSCGTQKKSTMTLWCGTSRKWQNPTLKSSGKTSRDLTKTKTIPWILMRYFRCLQTFVRSNLYLTELCKQINQPYAHVLWLVRHDNLAGLLVILLSVTYQHNIRVLYRYTGAELRISKLYVDFWMFKNRIPSN